MSPKPEQDSIQNEDVTEEMERIEDSLFDELENDARIQSGVADGSTRDDLDFIEMSGLANGEDAEPESIDELPEIAELDSDKPVSFFEKGVTDVDDEATPYDTALSSDSESVPVDPVKPATPRPANRSSESAAVVDLPEPDEVEQETPSEIVMTPDGLHADLLDEDTMYSGQMEESLETGKEDKVNFSKIDEQVSESDIEREIENAADKEGWSSHILDDDDNNDDDQKKESRPKRSIYHRRTHRRGWMGFTLMFLTVAILGALLSFLVYEAYEYYQRWSLTPENQLSLAEEQVRNNQYSRAITGYRRFIRENPEHPRRGDAQFSYAYTALLAADSTGRVDAAHDRALQLFEQFIADNPEHPKRSRAQVLAGILHHRLGNHLDVIRILRESGLQIDDQVAKHAILSTLAESYYRIGDYAQAESAYLQAANLDGNLTPDKDYDRLGDMFKQLSESVSLESERRTFRDKAIQYWENAARSYGIAPVDVNRIRTKIELNSALSQDSRIGVQYEQPAAVEPQQTSVADGISDEDVDQEYLQSDVGGSDSEFTGDEPDDERTGAVVEP